VTVYAAVARPAHWRRDRRFTASTDHLKYAACLHACKVEWNKNTSSRTE